VSDHTKAFTVQRHLHPRTNTVQALGHRCGYLFVKMLITANSAITAIITQIQKCKYFGAAIGARSRNFDA
jgi:hypothetical protein